MPDAVAAGGSGSPFGRNLYLSLYWRLEQGPAAAIGLSLVVGIVLAETLHELGATGVKVKWPNDLYLDDKNWRDPGRTSGKNRGCRACGYRDRD